MDEKEKWFGDINRNPQCDNFKRCIEYPLCKICEGCPFYKEENEQ